MSESLFIDTFLGNDYRLEYDDAFSTMKEKQYFLVVDEDLQEELYSLENSPEALRRLILEYNNISLPSSDQELMILLQNIFNAGKQEKASEMAEFIDELKSVINDYD